MNSRICKLITALLLGCSLLRCAAEKTISTGVRTHFASEAVLTSRELTTVIKLAKECGVPDVAEVSTFNNYHPSSFFSVGVKSAEISHGREISFVSVTIDCVKFSSRAVRRSSNVLKSKGGFWIDRRGVRTNVLTTFSVPGGTARLRLSGDVPLPIADRIVEAFATGKIRYGDRAKQEELMSVNLSQPISLGRDQERFVIWFSTGPWSLVFVRFTLDVEGVKIITVNESVS